MLILPEMTPKPGLDDTAVLSKSVKSLDSVNIIYTAPETSQTYLLYKTTDPGSSDLYKQMIIEDYN